MGTSTCSGLREILNYFLKYAPFNPGIILLSRKENNQIRRDYCYHMITSKQLFFLKLSFIIGTIADFVVGINWLLISLGHDIPNLLASFKGTGTDYRFAMYISTIFMLGWAVILFWGYLKPLERRGLLIITAVLILTSIIIEMLFYRNLLASKGFTSGIILRLLIISKFSFSYFYSLKKH